MRTYNVLYGDSSSEPTVYQVAVNNIGVKPVGCIVTIALYKSDDLYAHQYPVTCKQLKDNSYVNDLGLTGRNRAEVERGAIEADIVL